MQPESRLVRANGHYYRLSPRDYLTYKIFSNVTWFFLVIFGAASIVIKTDHFGSVAVPHQLWFYLALCVGVLGYVGINAIISHGVPVGGVDQNDPSIRAEERKRLTLRNTHTLGMILSSTFLIIFASLGIVGDLTLRKPINSGSLPIFLFGLGGFIYAIVRRHKIRAAFRADRERNGGLTQHRLAISWAHILPLGVIAFLVLSALYHLWIAAAQHPAVAQQQCSPRGATTWIACAGNH